MTTNQLQINRQLFEDTTHSPALIDIVGEDQLSHVIDHCFIANPYYPTTAMLEELQAKLPSLLKAYPSSNPELARQTLAKVLEVNSEHLLLGNGATELITLIEQHLIGDLAIPIPTFSEYIDKLADSGNARFFQLNPEKNYQLNLKEYAQWIKTKQLEAALIINPENPTGQLHSKEELTGFLNEVRHLKMALLDESFIDFADEAIPSLLDQVTNYNNLLIVRSMSKHCGVPGLRLGYCCTSNTDFLQTLRQAMPIWNINSLAEFFLNQLQQTNAIYHETRLRVIQDVRQLYQQLQEIPGYEVYPTGSNFILLKIEFRMTATELQMWLLENKGLYVRDCSNKIGIDRQHIRVASQGQEKDQPLIEALREISQAHVNTSI